MQKAAAGASGAVITEGAPLAASIKQAAELELQNYMIGYEGEISKQQALSEAQGYRKQGQLARTRGFNEMWGGLMGAGGTALTGLYDLYPPTPKPLNIPKLNAASYGAVGYHQY